MVFKEGEDEKFFDFIVSSKEASNIWRESHAMVPLAYFTQMDVEVEVVAYHQKNNMVEEPKQLFKPDTNFPWKREDSNATFDRYYEKNLLLDCKNCHFILLLNESHPRIIFPFTNIFQSFHEYLILIRNIYREWANISL